LEAKDYAQSKGCGVNRRVGGFPKVWPQKTVWAVCTQCKQKFQIAKKGDRNRAENRGGGATGLVQSLSTKKKTE